MVRLYKELQTFTVIKPKNHITGSVIKTVTIMKIYLAVVTVLLAEFASSNGLICQAKPHHGLNAFFRYYNPGPVDHFYTTNINEIGTATPGVRGNHGYVSEGIQCYLYTHQVHCSIPLYRYYSSGATDHFYTTNANEIGTTTPGQVGNHGYRSEGIAGYCFAGEIPGFTVPLYRYYQGSRRDHFYTTAASEIGTIVHGDVGQHGYRSEGIACWVIPTTFCQ